MPVIRHILSRKLEWAGYSVVETGLDDVELMFGLKTVACFKQSVRIETLRKVAEADFRQRMVGEVKLGLMED